MFHVALTNVVQALEALYFFRVMVQTFRTLIQANFEYQIQ